MSARIPLCRPHIGEEESKAVKEVLDSGWLVHGPKTKEFEEMFSRYIGRRYAISFNSWTSAAYALIKVLDINGEIIVPSFTMTASVNAIITAGCEPVFCDIEQESRNIDATKIEELITERTVAIMPVHFAGQSCNMEPIMKIASDYDLYVLEDSAETIGGTYRGKKTGSFGIGIFSFFPTKNITTGEGGMVTTDNLEIAEKLAIIKAHGISKSKKLKEIFDKPWHRVSIIAGYNFRTNEIQAALGIEQMKKLNNMNERRRELAQYISVGIRKIKQIDPPKESKNCMHVFQMYTVLLDKSVDRDRFLEFLKEKGIEVSVHFDPPVHKQPYYVDKFNLENLKLPVTEEVSSRIVTLPMFPDLTFAECDYIIESISEYFRNS